MLSSWQITKKSYLWIWLNKITLLSLLNPAIIVACLLGLLLLPSPLGLGGRQTMGMFLAFYVGVYFFCTAMVQIHRCIILSIPLNEMKRYPKPEKTFFVYFIATVILTLYMDQATYFILLVKSAHGWQFWLGYPLVIFGIIVIPAWLHTVFPSIAVKTNLGKQLSHGFLISKNRFWVIFKSYCMLCFPMFLLQLALTSTLSIISEDLRLFSFSILYVFKWAIVYVLYSFLFLEFSKPEFKRSS